MSRKVQNTNTHDVTMPDKTQSISGKIGRGRYHLGTCDLYYIPQEGNLYSIRGRSKPAPQKEPDSIAVQLHARAESLRKARELALACNMPVDLLPKIPVVWDAEAAFLYESRKGDERFYYFHNLIILFLDSKRLL